MEFEMGARLRVDLPTHERHGQDGIVVGRSRGWYCCELCGEGDSDRYDLKFDDGTVVEDILEFDVDLP